MAGRKTLLEFLRVWVQLCFVHLCLVHLSEGQVCHALQVCGTAGNSFWYVRKCIHIETKALAKSRENTQFGATSMFQRWYGSFSLGGYSHNSAKDDFLPPFLKKHISNTLFQNLYQRSVSFWERETGEGNTQMTWKALPPFVIRTWSL